MRKLTLLLAVAALAVLATSCQKLQSRDQLNKGAQAFRNAQYAEAVEHFKTAVELDPTYAAAYNNLAVAYEHEGQFSKAREAYERALKLEPNNFQIRQNYDLFREINDRTGQPKDKS